MNSITVIRNDADAETMRQSMQDEMGLTDAEWWQKTDPNDPPYKAGEKVWLDSIPGGVPNDMVPKLRKPQTIESCSPVPCSDGPLWSIDLVDIPYMLSQHDVRKVRKVRKDDDM
jgi:hypothetical protein